MKHFLVINISTSLVAIVMVRYRQVDEFCVSVIVSVVGCVCGCVFSV